jgi:hypothetical protein
MMLPALAVFPFSRWRQGQPEPPAGPDVWDTSGERTDTSGSRFTV